MKSDEREILELLRQRSKEVFVTRVNKRDGTERISVTSNPPECALFLEILKWEQMTKIADRLDLIYKVMRRQH